jgi:MOSC domain-containing protein YiiM
MTLAESAKVTFVNGIGYDSRGAMQNNRQITVMTKENWEIICDELQCNIPWTTRRANILIEGLDLKNTTGQQLRIGNFRLEITGETHPCNRMDEQFDGLTNALTPNWRGGVTCKLISEGEIKLGDRVSLETKQENRTD